MADKKKIWSVCAYLVTGGRVEWTFFDRDSAAMVHGKLCEALDNRDRIFRFEDDYDFDMSVNLRAVAATHCMSLEDAHRRRVDTEDTQEVISKEYEHEHYNVSKTGFAR